MTPLPAERLFVADSYLRSFCARVTAVDAGARRVALDRTAFFPGGGGQLADAGGVLAGAPVATVEEKAGEVWHVVAAGAPLPSSGADVEAEIDWASRLDHMQQHTGQHLLSAVVLRDLGAPTVSFHMGADESTIDLASAARPAALSEDEVERIEDACARAIAEDRDVGVTFHALADAPALGLRKPPPQDEVEKAGGRLRVVTIDGYDVSACCGTHLRRTGEILLVKIVGQERARGQVRLRFVAGLRALRDYRRKHRIVATLSARLTRAPEQVEDAVAKLDEERKRAAKEAQLYGEKVEAALAAELAVAAQAGLPPRVVARRFEPGETPDAGRLAARVLGLAPEAVCLFAEVRDGKAHLVFARREAASGAAAAAGAAAPDLAAALRATLAEVPGKGGGRPHFARGTLAEGGTAGDLDRALAHAVTIVRGGGGGDRPC